MNFSFKSETVRLRIVFPASLEITGSLLMLIRLLQQGPTGSVERCHDRRFPKRCANFNRTSQLRKPASSIWLPAAGPMGSFALDADTGRPTNWSAGADDNVQAVGTKFR